MKRQGRIPEKSRPDYYREYGRYMKWKEEYGIGNNCNSEAVVGMYLEEKSAEVVPTSLFTILSMLKSVIAVEHNTIIQVVDLQRMLAQKTKNYVTKKDPILTREQVDLQPMRCT